MFDNLLGGRQPQKLQSKTILTLVCRALNDTMVNHCFVFGSMIEKNGLCLYLRWDLQEVKSERGIEMHMSF